MFGLCDKTKKSINDLMNISEDCSCCLNFNYIVYKDVYSRYVIQMYKHTANDMYNVTCTLIKVSPASKEFVYNEKFDKFDTCLNTFLAICNKYKKIVDEIEE